jgi:hypothetical protein
MNPHMGELREIIQCTVAHTHSLRTRICLSVENASCNTRKYTSFCDIVGVSQLSKKCEYENWQQIQWLHTAETTCPQHSCQLAN